MIVIFFSFAVTNYSASVTSVGATTDDISEKVVNQLYGLDTSVKLCAYRKKIREFCNQFPDLTGKVYQEKSRDRSGENVSNQQKMPISGKKVRKKMNKEQEFVTVLQGKYLREFAQRLITGKYTIEKVTLNRYKVIEGENVPGQNYTLINRRSFVLLDKELYKIQSRENPLAFAIERALDNDALTFCIDKASVDKMPVKLITKTLSSAKVELENVSINATGNNYLLTISLVKSVSERALTENEQNIAEMFRNAIASAAGTTETEMQALPAPETVETTAKELETIPAK